MQAHNRAKAKKEKTAEIKLAFVEIAEEEQDYTEMMYQMEYDYGDYWWDEEEQFGLDDGLWDDAPWDEEDDFTEEEWSDPLDCRVCGGDDDDHYTKDCLLQ